MTDSSRKRIIDKLKEIDKKGLEFLTVNDSKFIPYSSHWGNLVFQMNKVFTYFDIDLLIGCFMIMMLSTMFLYYGLTNLDLISMIFSLIFLPISIFGFIIAIKKLSQPSIYIFDNGIYYPHAYHGLLKWENTFIPFYELNNLYKKRRKIVITTASGKFGIITSKADSVQLLNIMQMAWDKYRYV